MKCRDDDAFGQVAGHAEHPLVHLAGGFVGKGYRQNVFSRDVQVFQKMDNAGGNDLGLAGASPGEDQQGALDGVYGALLWRVEFFHELICSIDALPCANLYNSVYGNMLTYE